MFCLNLCIQMFLWLSLEHHLSYNYVKVSSKCASFLKCYIYLNIFLRKSFKLNYFIQLQDLQFVTSPTHLTKKTVPYQLYLGDLRRAYFFVSLCCIIMLNILKLHEHVFFKIYIINAAIIKFSSKL